MPNPNFDGDTISPWYISDQITADSSNVIASDKEGQPYAFALIPSQTSLAQVYLNNYLPSCGSPPPKVTLMMHFDFQFTGNSSGCTIGVAVNRSPDNIVDIIDDGKHNGEWQKFEGQPTMIQLTYDPLFTVKMKCDINKANTPAILITAIFAY